MERTERTHLLLAGAAAAFALVLAALYFAIGLQNLTEERIASWFLGAGWAGPLAVVFAQFAASVISPIPNSILTLVAGRIYGGFPGGFYSYLGGLLGAAATFWIGRALGRSFVEKFVQRHELREVDAALAKYGVWAILGGRLLPFLSFDAVSYAAGMTSMDFGAFMAASAIGTAPPVFAYAYAGEYSKQLDLVSMLLVSAAAFALFLLVSKYRLDAREEKFLGIRTGGAERPARGKPLRRRKGSRKRARGR